VAGIAFVAALVASGRVAAQTAQAPAEAVQPVYPPAGSPPGGYVQPVYPPGYVQPVYPPGYGQPVYAPPVYAPPVYAPPVYAPYPTTRAKPPRMNPDDPPPGYHTESRMRTGLVTGGALMLLIPYALSAGGAAAALGSNDRDYEPLFIPVIGPFIALSSTHALQGTNDGLRQAGRALGAIGLVFDGLIQVTGASPLVVGLALPRDVVVRDPPPGVPEVSLGPRGAAARWTF
jgi:hypothetical protein